MCWTTRNESRRAWSLVLPCRSTPTFLRLVVPPRCPACAGAFGGGHWNGKCVRPRRIFWTTKGTKAVFEEPLFFASFVVKMNLPPSCTGGVTNPEGAQVMRVHPLVTAVNCFCPSSFRDEFEFALPPRVDLFWARGNVIAYGGFRISSW